MLDGTGDKHPGAVQSFHQPRRRRTTKEAKKMSMQFEKTKSGATPLFGGTKPAGVYGQNPGSVNPDSRNGPAGGEVHRKTIVDKAGALGKMPFQGVR
jgi:hypothetical protein